MATLSSQQSAGQAQQSSIHSREKYPSNDSRSLSQDSGDQGGLYNPVSSSAPGSAQLDFSNDESPYLDFDFDGEADDVFDREFNEQMAGDIPEPNAHELHDKRKTIHGNENSDDGGGKRREADDKSNKKPGRKPLTSEPTTVG